MSEHKPSKPWRTIIDFSATGYRSENKTYEAIRGITEPGIRVSVECWDGGRWQLFERLVTDGTGHWDETL